MKHAYTPAGQLAWRQWARQLGGIRIKITYTQNAFGDLAGVSYNDGSAALSYGYDRRGRRISQTQGWP